MKELKNNYERPTVDVVFIEIEDVILQASGLSTNSVSAPNLSTKEDIW